MNRCPTCDAPAFQRNGDWYAERGNKEAERAVLNVYKFVLDSEHVNPQYCGECGEKVKNHSPATGHAPKPQRMPFMTETYLYDLLGKEDARSVLAYVNSLVRALGFEPWKMEEKAWQELEAE